MPKFDVPKDKEWVSWTCRMQGKQYEQLRLYAFTNRVTMAAVVAEALEAYLNDE